jgi:hypothetical protein
VAGLIATGMAYDDPPWDQTKKGLNRIISMTKYLQSTEGSVARGTDKKIKQIWNGAPSQSSALCSIRIYLDKDEKTMDWSGLVSDATGKRMDGCRQGLTRVELGRPYTWPCPGLKQKLKISFNTRDKISFVYGLKKWTSEQDNCDDGSWSQKDEHGEQVSIFTLLFQFVVLEADKKCRTGSSIATSNARFDIFVSTAPQFTGYR